MIDAIYVNLPVSDLQRSREFFSRLGFTFDSRFTNEQAAALVISGTIFAMLHTPESFKRFTKKPIVDARAGTEVLLALQVESRERVNQLTDKALKAGGREQRDPEDYGFMFGRAFEDPDGHIWEAFWMDPSQMPKE